MAVQVDPRFVSPEQLREALYQDVADLLNNVDDGALSNSVLEPINDMANAPRDEMDFSALENALEAAQEWADDAGDAEVASRAAELLEQCAAAAVGDRDLDVAVRAVIAEYDAARADDLAAALDAQEIDDGDDLPNGEYRVVYDANGEPMMVQTSDKAPVIETWHGTIQAVGEVISELEPQAPHDGRLISTVPGVYSSQDEEVAHRYANPANIRLADDFFPRRFGDDEQGFSEGQVYHLAIVPNEVVDLDSCQDDQAVEFALAQGSDVIDCPDFFIHPETVAFDPDDVHIQSAVALNRVGEKTPLPVPPKPRRARARKPDVPAGPPAKVNIQFAR